MKKILHLAILIAFCLLPVCTHAQENAPRQILNQAESEYEIGRIEQAIELLQGHLSKFEGNLKQSAYRLLALCYLMEDRDQEARRYAEQLIKLNNYYNSADDPARFQDLINELKGGVVTTITTASSQSESVNEAPVAITIITAEMIEQLGYNKNLGQILAAYVPGMAEVLDLDGGANLSTHGAFSNGQELILIMENGHRLNTRFNNIGPISYSVGTEKIDHIEVLRGPASSLYGNVALSAVVNIITKSGRTTNGIKAKYGYGTFATHKADLLMGTQFMDVDIFAWGSYYKSNGKIRHFGEDKGYLKEFLSPVEQIGGMKWIAVGPDKIYIDRYRDTPSYDVGMTLKFKGFDVMLSKKNVSKAMMLTNYNGGYRLDKFHPINDLMPGSATSSTHAEIGYSRQVGKVYLNASLYGDWYVLSIYDVVHDSILNVSPIETEEESGKWSFNSYREHTMGGTFRASSDYRLANMKGNFLAGVQYEHFSLSSNLSCWGMDIGIVSDGNIFHEEIIDAGKENILSFFIQDKHYIMSQLILNAGARYDFKYRQNENVVRTFSPRLALMYVPNDRFSLKLSYSEAFSDISFYYRYISKVSNYSSDPQHLSAIQLTAMGTIPPMHLNYEVNLFYNRFSNLLCWQDRLGDFLLNSGRLTNVGVGGSAYYAYKRLSANLSLFLCHDTSSEHYYYNTSKKMVCDVPHFTLHLHGAWKLLQQNNHEIKVYGNSSYLGRKLNYSAQETDDYFVPGKLLIDLGIKYNYRQMYQLSLDCENIFDTYSYLCGPTYQYAPMFQRGRTLMASLSIQF